MTTENVNIDLDNLTTEQLAKLLNNTNVLSMAVSTAKAKGLISEPKAEPKKVETFDLKAPEMPAITDDDTTVSVAKKMADYTKQLNDFHTKQREWDKKELQGSIQETEFKQKAEQVKKFASEPSRSKHFQDPKIFTDIEKFYNTGDDIESAYKKALKLNDIKEDVGENTGASTERKPSSNLSVSDVPPRKIPSGSSEDDSRRNPPSSPKNLRASLDVRSSAERALDGYLKTNPNALKDIEGE